MQLGVWLESLSPAVFALHFCSNETRECVPNSPTCGEAGMAPGTGGEMCVCVCFVPSLVPCVMLLCTSPVLYGG